MGGREGGRLRARLGHARHPRCPRPLERRAVARAAGVARRRAAGGVNAVVRRLGDRLGLDRGRDPDVASGPDGRRDAHGRPPHPLPQLAGARAARVRLRGRVHRRQLAGVVREEAPRLLAARAREGAPDRARLGRAGHLLLARHPGLRTRPHRRAARPPGGALDRRAGADRAPARGAGARGRCSCRWRRGRSRAGATNGATCWRRPSSRWGSRSRSSWCPRPGRSTSGPRS